MIARRKSCAFLAVKCVEQLVHPVDADLNITEASRNNLLVKKSDLYHPVSLIATLKTIISIPKTEKHGL